MSKRRFFAWLVAALGAFVWVGTLGLKPSQSSGNHLVARGTPGCADNLPGAGANCGPDNEDCCAARTVVGGTYQRGFDGAQSLDHAYPATVSDFALDRYLVTVGRFRAFLDAGGGTRQRPPPPGDGAHPLIPGSGWKSKFDTALEADRATLSRNLRCDDEHTSSWTEEPGPNENLPANCVSWFEAFAFCAWDGGRLPTEAEWNYAAAGGAEQRAYPWSRWPGDERIDPSFAVYAQPRVKPVGSHSPAGDGRWGQADLAGNVWEWMLDAAGTGRLLPTEGARVDDPAGYPMPCEDCISTAGPNRVLRGAGFGIPAPALRTSVRRADPPNERAHVFGLRCARAPTDKATEVAGDTSTGDACVAECDGRECGSDGCGRSCGQCPQETTCGNDGRCRAGGYPSGPYGLSEGSVLDDFNLRAIADPAVDVHAVRDMRLSEFFAPSRGSDPAHDESRALLIHMGAAWSKETSEVSQRFLALHRLVGERGVRFLLFLTDGERVGQGIDTYGLVHFLSKHPMQTPIAMDPFLRVNPGNLPLSLLVDVRSMRIVAMRQSFPDKRDVAFWRAFEDLLGAPLQPVED